MVKPTLILGFGNVGTRCVELMLKGVCHADILVVGVSDSSGGVFCSDGLDLAALLSHKKTSGGVSQFKMEGASFVGSSQELYELCKFNKRYSCALSLVIDLSPVDLKTGGVSLPILQDALASGIHCVLANKAPLVLDYTNLTNLARSNNASILFSATVCGGLPVINVGRRDLIGAKFHKISGIFNSTSNYVLVQLEKGFTVAAAIRDAQQIGIAEADPSLDLEGYDTANKLVIITNSVMGFPCTLADVDLSGIQGVTKEDIDAAKDHGETIRLVATATRIDDGAGTGAVTLSVKPTRVSLHSFFGRCSDTSMCVRFDTDIYEEIEMMTYEKGVYPTSAAVLRDCFDVCAGHSS